MALPRICYFGRLLRIFSAVADDAKSVYVRNLPFHATEADLEAFFCQAGPVADIRRGANAEGQPFPTLHSRNERGKGKCMIKLRPVACVLCAACGIQAQNWHTAHLRGVGSVGSQEKWPQAHPALRSGSARRVLALAGVRYYRQIILSIMSLLCCSLLASSTASGTSSSTMRAPSSTLDDCETSQ